MGKHDGKGGQHAAGKGGQHRGKGQSTNPAYEGKHSTEGTPAGNQDQSRRGRGNVKGQGGR